MSILLAIIVVTIKSFCPYDFSPEVLCQMSLHVAFVTIPLAFGCVLLIDLSTPTNIGSILLLIIEMTSGFGVLTFVTPLLSTL